MAHLLVICHLVLWQLVLWLLKLQSPCKHAVCQTCFFHFFHIFYLVISKAVVFTCFVKNSFLMLKAVEELLLYLGCHYSCKPFCITWIWWVDEGSLVFGTVLNTPLKNKKWSWLFRSWFSHLCPCSQRMWSFCFYYR